MTAFYFARGMTFELIYKNLTEEQWNLIYVSMLRARTQTWLETHFGSKDSADALACIQRYSDTILVALRSTEARELSCLFREDLKPLEGKAPSSRFTREQISDEMRDLVIQKLQDAHSELTEDMARALYESMT